MEKEKILLVEDDRIAQMIVGRIISDQGFDVDVAGSGKEALALLEKSSDYVFVFMDIGLPDTNGFDLTEKIKQSGLLAATVPIVALTAHSEQEYRDKAEKAGLNDFFVKPLTVQIAKEIFKKFGLVK